MQPLLARFLEAFNKHDPDAFADCFHEDFRGEQPAHPARAFTGRGQVRENWGRVFARVPDAQLEVQRHAFADGVLWMEVRITGTREDRTELDLRGVAVNGVDGDRIAWANLYLEEVERSGPGIREAVGGWVHALRGI